MDEDANYKCSSLKTPTVIKVLKNVLSQYPDNGQILKELVQNAEDAEASSFEVVWDTRQLTADVRMKRFVKAPALLVYNNSVFSNQDWEGIQMLSESIKEDNLLKVGQFGLGFKSVFHLTDYVTIISGENVLFMDPSEPLEKMCREISLAKLFNIIPCSYCIDIWGTYLKSDHLVTGHFPGTIFWFPLRKVQSKISSTVYDPGKVDKLFQSFSVEAPYCLTFLKSLENITIKKVEKNKTNNVLQVNLNNANLSNARAQRKSFLESLIFCKGFPEDRLTCIFDISIDSLENGSFRQQEYKVLHYLPSSNDKHHMPLVGVAAPMSLNKKDDQGKLFCFLPLPFENSNDTGLPVQINGYFALDQNRRHVKWKTKESSSEPDVIWNESLVENVVSSAYTYLLQNVLNEVTCNISPEVWYSLLPLINLTADNDRWKVLTNNIWTNLLHYPIIYSYTGRKMLRVNQVISVSSLNLLSPSIAKSVKSVLEDCNLPLAEIPPSVEETLIAMGVKLTYVTPNLLRSHLKNKEIKSDWNRFHLLEYILSDHKYGNLPGLELLPLQNGQWCRFAKEGSLIFVCTEDQVATFKGAEDHLLLSPLKSEISNNLRMLAVKGRTTLRIFSPCDHISELLPISISHLEKAKSSSTTIKPWLQKLWSVLNEVSLKEVENFPILPTKNNPSMTHLISLSSAIIVKKMNCDRTEACVEALRLLNVQVIPEPPSYIRHPELHSYYSRLDGNGVAKALMKLLRSQNTSNIIDVFNSVRTEKQRIDFCKLLEEIRVVEPQVKELLKKLKLFKAVEERSIYDVCLEEVGKIHPIENFFPVCLPKILIKPCNANIRSLAIKLGGIQISKEDLCLMALKRNYSPGDTRILGVYILRDHDLCKKASIWNSLKHLKFIKTPSGRYCSANDLYNPLDENIDALIDEDLIPDDGTYKEFNSNLKKLGLKDVCDMPKRDLIRIAEEVSLKNLNKKDSTLKIKSLLKVIDKREDYAEICDELQDVNFICGMSSKPFGYPDSLTWATKDFLLRPSEVKNANCYSYLVGSVVPLVDCKELPNVSSSFRWNVPPDIEQVIAHLEHVIEVCPPPWKIPGSSYYKCLKKIYQHLLKYVGSRDEDDLLSLREIAFIFTRNGFKCPNEVYIPSGKEDLQLLPYMNALPFELCESQELFCLLGAFESQSQSLFYKVLKEIQNQHTSNVPCDLQHDLQIVLSILHKLVTMKKGIDPNEVLMPVEPSEERLEFAELGKCAYSNQNCDWLHEKEFEVKIVHRSVGISLAKALGVESLNKHLLADEEAVMEWGQNEPLTTRIHNLLKEYRDGISVLKELVQNADDAGATQISFLYDERQSKDFSKRLITDQLKECQGPALWAFNNSSFTESDFQNLCKLGGGTKELIPTNIGKFGLGFCSVYNLTDVPSLVSGNDYVIFDPHEKYLHGNKCGVRYNFTKKMNQMVLKKLTGQFEPFKNLFGCQIQETFSYDGTLFRFPLRTTSQARESAISNQNYSHNEMIALLSMFRQIIGEVLLFTQNIKEVNVYHLSKDSDPSQMNLLYRSERNLIKSSNNYENKPLEECSRLFNHNHKWNGKIYEENLFVDIRIACFKECLRLFGNAGKAFTDKERCTSQKWLISWHSGEGESCKVAEKENGKVLSLAAVAVPLNTQNRNWKPMNLKALPCGFYNESHFHCFLPLPVKIDLPVQINGYFQMSSDRTSLVTRTEDDRFISQDWNEVLMKDAVTCAYVNLIINLKEEGIYEEHDYFSHWPCMNSTHGGLIEHVVCSFYKRVEEDDLEIFMNRDGWFPFSNCVFLMKDFYDSPDIGEIAFEYMRTLLNSSDECEMPKDRNQIVLFPEMLLGNFEDVSIRVVREHSFFVDHFLPTLSYNYINVEQRNKLVLHVLDREKDFLEILKGVYCVPTLPNGKLKRPIDLVDPTSPVAHLFNISDERYPEPEFMKGNRSLILQRLGMKTDQVSIEMIVESAMIVNEMSCLSCAKERSGAIISYLSTTRKELKEISQKLRDINFIPIMAKPKDWPVKWKGEEVASKENLPCYKHKNLLIQLVSFASPECLCSPSMMRIAGSTHCIYDSVEKDKDLVIEKEIVYKMLGIATNPEDITFESVYAQLFEYCSHNSDLPAAYVTRAVFEIYAYLDDQVRRKELDLSSLKQEKILLTTQWGFREPMYFGLHDYSNCAPALFSVKSEGYSKYGCMIKSLGIDQEVSARTIYDLLLKMKKDFDTRKVTEKEIVLLSDLLGVLFKIRPEENDEISFNDLALPDSNCVMCIVSDLCIDDGVQMENTQFRFLHEKISCSGEMRRWLGIEDKIKKRLLDSSYRMKFGQKEPLVTRLKNILRNYPCDSGIMKEMLQNADDAGATEITFIKDFRDHPKGKLFDEKWEPLQGPSLCVYNDKGFTKRDLDGIQNLGDSVKIADPASTGQYGIGFNAVYHLTDAPSFITRGREIPTVGNETICLFDPLCLYDPLATKESPGVQLVNLNSLRNLYPDSFKGYLEEIWKDKEEGTMFRFPLRKVEESEIGDVIKTWKLEELINEFKSEMKVCLLFLKNIHKISVGKIEDDELVIEYAVETHIDHKEIDSKKQLGQIVKSRTEQCNDNDTSVFLNMQRLSYELEVRDSEKEVYRWLIAHQFGSSRDIVPPLILEAYHNEWLRLLPQAGVAFLLSSSSPIETNLFRNFVFLPLPGNSGYPMCFNGHFILDNSRRELWIGSSDYKASWNQWLMENVLAPVVAETILSYRKLRIPCDQEMSYEAYTREINIYKKMLPVCKNAVSKKWKDLAHWVYQYAKEQELPIFYMYIPFAKYKSATISGRHRGSSSSSKSQDESAKSIDGCLKWVALAVENDKFPMYFNNNDGKLQLQNHAKDILKRLGMKIGGTFIRRLLEEAGIKIEFVNPDFVYHFLKSWNEECPDRCRPSLLLEVEKTPFLSVKNVCDMFKYISKATDFSNTLNNIPLLVDGAMKLRHFDDAHPVFLTQYGELFPEFCNNFLNRDFYNSVKSNLGDSLRNFECFRYFTLENFEEKLHAVLDSKLNAVIESDGYPMSCMVPIEQLIEAREEKWISLAWKYILSELKRTFKVEKKSLQVNAPQVPMLSLHQNTMNEKVNEMDWNNAKQYLLQVLGNWTIYPVSFQGKSYVMPINESCHVLRLGVLDPLNFRNLHVPHQEWIIDKDHIINIDQDLNLGAPLSDPSAVLDALYHWRNQLNELGNDKLNCLVLPNYFVSKCSKFQLSIKKLRSLKMYKDITGRICTLNNNFIVIRVLTDNCNLIKLGMETSTVIIKREDSTLELFKYLDSKSVLSEIGLFTYFVLPNLSYLTEVEFVDLLGFLKYKLETLAIEERESWSQEKIDVVDELKRTPFILINGKLVTADNLYDQRHPVLKVFKPQTLPKEYKKYHWHKFLCLAGMVHNVSKQMFIKFARSLNKNDCEVQRKSKVLVNYLFNHYKEFESALSEIEDIEFLVPDCFEFHEEICPSYKTDSGLIAFSSCTATHHKDLLWTTMNILPHYAALPIPWDVEKKPLPWYHSLKTVPRQNLFLHIRNIISRSPPTTKCLTRVMNSIYNHLKTENNAFLSRFAREEIPIVHLGDQGKFAKVDVVVHHLQEEIEPYLYRTPVTYGTHFDLLEKLGVCRKVKSDHYVKVLNLIYEQCQDEELNPEEEKCMKMAMKGLTDDIIGLTAITYDILHLPTKNGTLVRSCDVYVVDNNALEKEVTPNIEKPLFVGLGMLNIDQNDGDFVNNLPVRLRPKFLSDLVREQFDVNENEMIENSDKADQMTSFIISETFQSGMKRLLNHYRVLSGSPLNPSEIEDNERKLNCIQIRAMKKIETTLIVEDKSVGVRSRTYFEKDERDINDGLFYYFLESSSMNLIMTGLGIVYSKLFPPVDKSHITNIINFWEQPKNIHEYLEEHDIQDFHQEENVREYFSQDIGTYLREEFIHMLDNEICKFHDGEIVVMKKYLCKKVESDEDNRFVIVKVRSLFKESTYAMNREYKVITKESSNPVIVKAHMLYKFIRKQRAKVREIYLGEQAVDVNEGESENNTSHVLPYNVVCDEDPYRAMSEEEIMKKVKEEVINIWKSPDELERRHLFRRLYLKWHPDKNPDRTELCTMVMQYIMSLVRRLENGETIPQNDDYKSSPCNKPSDFYREAFKPSKFSHGSSHGSGSSRPNFRARSSQEKKSKMSDRVESEKWMKQAQHDYNEASKGNGVSACWVVYMCYQAAEKSLKAILYLLDCEEGAKVHSSSKTHDLLYILTKLTSIGLDSGSLETLQDLVSSIDNCVEAYEVMQYPTHEGPPHDRFMTDDADLMLAKTKTLIDNVSGKF